MLTNGIGSHIGYSICMERPVYYHAQKTSYELNNNKFSELIKEQEPHITQVKEKINQLFGDFSFTITQEQISFIEEYWGKWNK
jgi:hypothetical protein